MQPDAVEPQAVQASRFRSLEEIGQQAERTLRRIGEKLGLDDADAGIDERRDAALLALASAGRTHPW